MNARSLEARIARLQNGGAEGAPVSESEARELLRVFRPYFVQEHGLEHALYVTRRGIRLCDGWWLGSYDGSARPFGGTRYVVEFC